MGKSPSYLHWCDYGTSAKDVPASRRVDSSPKLAPSSSHSAPSQHETGHPSRPKVPLDPMTLQENPNSARLVNGNPPCKWSRPHPVTDPWSESFSQPCEFIDFFFGWVSGCTLNAVAGQRPISCATREVCAFLVCSLSLYSISFHDSLTTVSRNPQLFLLVLITILNVCFLSHQQGTFHSETLPLASDLPTTTTSYIFSLCSQHHIFCLNNFAKTSDLIITDSINKHHSSNIINHKLLFSNKTPPPHIHPPQPSP